MGSIEKLANKIEEYNKSSKKIDKNQDNQGIMVFSEIFSGIFVGSIIGYFVDSYFMTKPYAMIICFLIGVISSFLNIYRNMTK